MKRKKKYSAIVLIFVFIAFAFSSCKKEKGADLPTITLKSGTGYTSSSSSVPKSSILKVGIIADKNKADLRRLDITVLLAHENTEQTKKTIYMDDNEKEHFDYDYTELKTGDDSGTQTWRFKITDKDGNLGETSIYLTVQ